MGASVDRVRLLLNRAAEPFPIPPAQIEAAVGHPIDHMFPSDYKTVSAALNSGVPLAATGNTPLASQFDSFTRRMLDAEDLAPAEASARERAAATDPVKAATWAAGSIASAVAYPLRR